MTFFSPLPAEFLPWRCWRQTAVDSPAQTWYDKKFPYKLVGKSKNLVLKKEIYFASP